MIDIAIHNQSGPSMLKVIADRQEVSPKYLDHILSVLRKAGLIKNNRRKGGGYYLTRPASKITMKDIVQAVEGSLSLVECVDNPDSCKRIHTCATRDIWARLTEAIEDVLEATTLENLVEYQNNKKQSPMDYTI